jgi:Domain of unknown function (DUF4372)
VHEGPYVFAQLMQHVPLTTFCRCIARYGGEHRIKRFSCLDQYLCLAFAQLTWRESLRDIEACLRAQSSKLYHLGFRSTIARNTSANANAVRDWRILPTSRNILSESRGGSMRMIKWHLNSTRPSMPWIQPLSISERSGHVAAQSLVAAYYIRRRRVTFVR